jgi:hypothetical protein
VHANAEGGYGLDMPPHLSVHPGNEMERPEEAPAAVATAGMMMIAMEIRMNVDSPGMAGCQFLMLHVCNQHISWTGLNRGEVICLCI